MNSPGSIFLIAVLYQPTEAERIEGKKKRVIVDPQHILADDTQAAVEIPEPALLNTLSAA